MEKKEILQKTKEILFEIQQQVSVFEQHNYQISDIELDLFLANAKFLVDHAQIMKRLQEVSPVAPTPPATPIQVVPTAPVVEIPISSPIVEAPIDPLLEAKPTLNDLLADRPEVSLATKFESEPIADLKSIINLNDKLVFVKDLFNGYSLAYQEAIEVLNRLASLEEAKTYLEENYAQANDWAAYEATTARFYELLARRYTK
ncbi:MAG: hypothetical protein ACKOWL_03660 [Sphingobacteriaceae bacterium]